MHLSTPFQTFSTRFRFYSTTSHPPSNFYTLLCLPPTATPYQIKKSFYALSKTTHPDLHPDDPTAPTRFQSLTEAYATLSDPAKRAVYDRSINVYSYHRHNPPLGTRAPSGLSKRRTPFRPSSWSHRRTTSSPHDSPPNSDPVFSRSYDGTAGTAGHAAWFQGTESTSSSDYYYPRTSFYPWSTTPSSQLSHFDSMSHLKTQFKQEELRKMRQGINQARERMSQMKEKQEAGWGVVVGGIAMGVGAIWLAAKRSNMKETKQYLRY